MGAYVNSSPSFHANMVVQRWLSTYQGVAGSVEMDWEVVDLEVELHCITQAGQSGWKHSSVWLVEAMGAR